MKFKQLESFRQKLSGGYFFQFKALWRLKRVNCQTCVAPVEISISFIQSHFNA